VFLPSGALKASKATQQNSSSTEQVAELDSSSTEQAKKQNSSFTKSTWMDRLAYDIDAFVPVLNLQVKQKWEPNEEWRKTYAVVPGIAGWLLVPLFLASWSGLLMRTRGPLH
jgi:hypothetical protein